MLVYVLFSYQNVLILQPKTNITIKEDLIWITTNESPFSKKTINRSINTLLIIKDYEED